MVKLICLNPVTSGCQILTILTYLPSCEEFKEVFPAELPAELPPARAGFHTIPLVEGSSPPFRPMYRLSPKERAEVEKQVRELLAKGFIKPCKYSSVTCP